MIDDMEDGNGAVCPNAGRSGGWFVITSSTAVVTTPTAGTSFLAYSLSNDPQGASQYGMRFAGSGFSSTDPWASLGVSVGGTGAYDASGYSAIRFWAKSHGGNLSIRVNLSTTETRATTDGGTCTATKCGDSYGAFITFTNTWQQYTVYFNAINQSGWGAAAAKNLAHLWTVEFNYVQIPYGQAVTNPNSFEFLVDDVQFVN